MKPEPSPATVDSKFAGIAPEYALAVAEELGRQRRAIASESPNHFARVYLSHAFTAPPCRLHSEVNARLTAMTTRRGTRLAVAAPRGHAKSTLVSLAYVLWCLLFQKEPFVLLVSATAEQAGKLLDHVKRQIETNPLLRSDFPHLVGSRAPRPWRKDSILIPSPPSAGSAIPSEGSAGSLLTSYSAGQNLRGARHERNRPTLIVCDDLEDKIQVASQEQRVKTSDWFASTLLKAGSPSTNVVVVGTVLHHDALLANLMDPRLSPGWDRLGYRAIEKPSAYPELWERWKRLYRGEDQREGLGAIDAAQEFYDLHRERMDEGAVVLWPETYSYRQLMEIRLREGESAFQAEFQNTPIDPEMCVFAVASLRYWNATFESAAELIGSLAGFGEFYGACDPGLGGAAGRGDFSAIVLVYKHWPTMTNYVVVADVARRTPSQTIDRIVEYLKLYEVRLFSVESNQFQQLMVDQLISRLRGEDIATIVWPVTNSVAKVQRIAGLEPLVTQGRVVFSSAHEVLMDQLREFPLGRHDDGPDALQMAVAESNRVDEPLNDPDRPPGLIGSTSGAVW